MSHLTYKNNLSKMFIKHIKIISYLKFLVYLNSKNIIRSSSTTLIKKQVYSYKQKTLTQKIVITYLENCYNF